MSKTLNSILQKYYNEANKGLDNSKSPSSLNRGEGTEKEFYILKIDLVRSTIFLSNRFPQTYLKFAHVFLSSIDEITRAFGADANQVEYAGDSVMAYFDAAKVPAIDVIMAAYWSKEAALNINALDPIFKKHNGKTRVVLHYGKLIVAKIGPWGDHRLSAIGKEIHKVGKLEKKVSAGVGHVTKEFGQRVELKTRRQFLKKIYENKKIETIQSPPVPKLKEIYSNPLLSAFGANREKTTPTSTLADYNPFTRAAQTTNTTLLTEEIENKIVKTEKVLAHWEIKWPLLKRHLQQK